MISMDLAISILRVVLGLLFIGHGAQKLFGWFGGYGLSGTAQFFESLGINPPKFWAFIAGAAEFLGGLGLALGLFTPLAAAAIIGVMLTAIAKVHWTHGLWINNNGAEYAIVNTLLATFLALFGPGLYALDQYLNITYPMPLTFLIGLAVAVAAVLVVLASGRRAAQVQPRSA